MNAPHDEPPLDATAEFADLAGRTWRFKITVGLARRLKSERGLDIFAALSGKMFQELAAEPLALCDLIWWLIADQAAAAAVDEAAFWEQVDDSVLDAALFALFEAIVRFFRPDKQAPLRAVLAKLRAADKKQVAALAALAGSPALDAKIETLLAEQLAAAEAALGGAGFGKPPVTPTATPTP